MDLAFTNLLIVAAVGFAAPLALGFAPSVRVPSIVLEIVAGIIVGPAVLGWVHVDEPVQVFSTFGLAYLLFLAGLEIDFMRLRGRVLRLALTGFVVSLGIALVVGLLLKAGGYVAQPLFVAIVLSATSLGVLVPVLKDAGESGSTFGQLIIASGTIADFATVILLSLFFSREAGSATTKVILLAGPVRDRCPGRARHRRRRALDAHRRRAGPPAGHDGADPHPRRVRAARRARRVGRQAGPRGHPRRVHRRSDTVARRPGPADDPRRLPPQARGGGLRHLHPDLLRDHRRQVRPQRAHRRHVDSAARADLPGRAGRSSAGCPPCSTPGDRARAGARGRADAVDVAAVHRRRDAGRARARRRHRGQRSRADRRRAAVGRDLPGRVARRCCAARRARARGSPWATTSRSPPRVPD